MATTPTPVAAPRQQFINIDLVRRITLCHGLNGTSRSVLLTVGMHANKERQQCFCSIATLAHKSGWSRRTITQHLTRLQQLGYLSLIGMHHSGTSIYQVRLERLPTDVGASQHPHPSASHDGHGGHDGYGAYEGHDGPSPAVAPAPAPASATPSPAPSPVPTPAPPPPPEEANPTPCAECAHPPSASCVPPTQDMPAPHAPAAHQEEVEQGFEQPKEEEAANSVLAAQHSAPVAAPVTEAVPSARPVFCFQSSLPAGQMDADTIGLLNRQRQRNGKDPLAHRDIVHMSAEAAKAGLTPLAAAQWVLAGPKRNFFKAEFYAPPLTQPAATSCRVTPTAAPVATTVQQSPRPASLTPEQQAEQDRAREAGRAHLRQYLASLPSASGQDIATSHPGTAINTRWASHAIEQFVAGQPVSHYRLKVACEVLGIPARTLQRSAAQGVVSS